MSQAEVTHLVDWILPLLRDRSIEVQGEVLGKLFARLLLDHASMKERAQILMAYSAGLQQDAFPEKVQ